MATNFTYGAGNPIGVPTTTKAPTAPTVPTVKKPVVSKAAVDSKEVKAVKEASAAVDVASAASDKALADYLATTKTGTVVSGGSSGDSSSGLTAEQIAANNAAQLIKQQQEAQDAANFANRKSAYDLLFQQFSQYGLGSLVEPLKDLVQQNVSPSEFTIRLQNTDAYKKRFSANADRISKGLSALNPAEYIALEDQYQNIMRNYGLPSSYYAKDSMGTQAGFNQLLANDVSASELEDRITTGQSRVINASPEVKQALRQFYPNITDGDILAYVLDPTKALVDIKRKVTASEIGGAAIQQGLNTNVTTAEDLAAYGVNRQQAITGYQNVASVLPTASKLSNIYGEANVDYTQSTAEQEFLKNNVLASQKRAQLTNLETAQFGGSAGVGPAGLSTQMLRKSSSAGQY
jgi:hypothetical protein